MSYHVSQYQTIISELRGEIGRLKEKMVVGEKAGLSESKDRRQVAELKALREEMVANFNEQMKLRYREAFHFKV